MQRDNWHVSEKLLGTNMVTEESMSVRQNKNICQ